MSMSKCSQRGTKINVFSSVLAKALLRHEGNSKTVSPSPADIGTGRERKRYKVVLQFPALASLFISSCTACLPFHFCKAAYCWETDAQTEPRRSINISGSVFVWVEEIHKDIDLKKKKKSMRADAQKETCRSDAWELSSPVVPIDFALWPSGHESAWVIELLTMRNIASSRAYVPLSSPPRQSRGDAE